MHLLRSVCVWFCLIFLTVSSTKFVCDLSPPYPGFTVWSSARGGVTVDIPWSPPHHITSECALEGNAKKEVQLFDKLIVGDPGPGGYHFKWVPANRIGELANCGLNVDTSCACLPAWKRTYHFRSSCFHRLLLPITILLFCLIGELTAVSDDH